MKRELRRHCRRSKENKATIRRQGSLVKRKNADISDELPTRKIRKITEGLPNISKFDENETANASFTLPTFSSRFIDSTDIKKVKPVNVNVTSSLSNSPNISNTSSPSPSSQILFQLPTLGRKFNSDTKELIMKNTAKTSCNDNLSIPSPSNKPPIPIPRKLNTSTAQRS